MGIDIPLEQPGVVIRDTRDVASRATEADDWQARLAAGDPEGAWDALLASHRALIFATIGNLVRDRESRMDAFAAVCEGLRRDDLARLRRFQPGGPARFSTWLVTVCRNLVVDWYRATQGRRRLDPALGRLAPMQQRLFVLLSHGRLSFAAAYETLRAGGEFDGTWREFVRLLRELHATVLAEAGPLARELVGFDVAWELQTEDDAESADPGSDYARVMAELGAFPPDVQAAVLLFTVDGAPADEVARVVGWPGRKAVYNRVYRTLEAIRARLADPS